MENSRRQSACPLGVLNAMTKTKLVVEDQHLVALSCTLIIYRGLDA
jgi:hypothetical protein